MNPFSPPSFLTASLTALSVVAALGLFLASVMVWATLMGAGVT